MKRSPLQLNNENVNETGKSFLDICSWKRSLERDGYYVYLSEEIEKSVNLDEIDESINFKDVLTWHDISIWILMLII